MDINSYKLVFEADFSQDGPLSSEDWLINVGEKWANNEQQAYTDSPSNVYIKDGALHLVALKEKYGIRDYTSGRITTYGKHSWQYGYFEVKAKLPKGKGSWPAIWMLPDSIQEGVGWPLCGEIDICEHIGRMQDSIWFSLHSQRHNHTRKDTKQYTIIKEFKNVSEEFHTYGCEWTPDYIEYYIDGEAVCLFRKDDDKEDQSFESWPFDQPFHLILNIAVGGGLGGEIDEEALPYRMDIESVRVYQK